VNKIRSAALMLLFIFPLSSVVYAQTSDSVTYKTKWHKTKAFKVSFAPTLLATGSLILFASHGGEHTIIHDIPGFTSPIDDILQFVPLGIVYGLDIAGVKAKNDVLNQSLLLLKAELIMAAFVYPLKSATKVPRPSGTANNSFPSGHTAQAFVSATFLHKEYGHLSAWYSIGAYTMATTTGIFRILKNRHRLTDVLMGAGIGILSTNIAYATHQYKWGRKDNNFSVVPTYSDKNLGLYIRWRL